MFIDIPDFSDVNYRHKQTLRRFIPSSETGVSAKGIKYPPGVVDGEKIKLFFNHLVGDGRSERVIEKLPLPVSLIATDIGTGERVVMRDGSLTSAMRASMSVPGLLAPAELQGRKLVDGGLVDNVPIGEALERCNAEIVIAVNVGSPLLKPEEVGSLLSVSAQMVNILTEQNVTRSLATLKHSDIYIKPDLGTITAGDFARNAEAADRGRAAAEAVREQLARLSTGAPQYAAWRENIERVAKAPLKIDEIEIVGLQRVNPAMIERHLKVANGDALQAEAIDKDVLRILPVEKNWGPDYLRFALNLEADTSRGSNWAIRVAYQKTLLNSLGAEFLATAQVGDSSLASVDFYHPLDPAQHFFVQSTAAYTRTPANICQNGKQIAQFLTHTMVGMNIGIIGQARVGWIEQKYNLDRDIGSQLLPDVAALDSGWKAEVLLDQLNRLYFASSGWLARAAYFDSQDGDYSRADADLTGAFALGKTVFTGRLRYTGSPSGRLPFYDAASLGGFLNMSAFARGEIIGDDVSYASLRGEQIIGTFPLGLRGDVRLGIAIEGAHVGRLYSETNLRDTRIIDSTTLYLGSETPFGPIYLGYGYSTSGSSNVFLSIGIP